MKKMTLHILIGSSSDLKFVKDASIRHQSILWVVPKSAKQKDDVLIFIQGKGIVGYGHLVDNPVKITDGDWKGRFSAKIDNILFFETPISENQLKETFPEWDWLKYPRKYTTPPDKIAIILKGIVSPKVPFVITKGKSGNIIDRDNPKVAEGILEDLLPDGNQRSTICSDLSLFWQYANRNFPSKSFITLAKNHIRLNVCMVESFVIAADHILSVCDKTYIDPMTPSHYKSHPDALPISLSHNDYIKQSINLQTAIFSMINKLGATRKHPSAFKAHSPGIVKFLEQNFPHEITNDFLDHVDSQFFEGAQIQVTVNRYERDVKARKACIRHYGSYKCQICKMDFLSFYGFVGKDFIIVHHLKPLSSKGENHEIEPEKDLLPVCPNCHAMLHMRKPEPYTPEELEEMIRNNSALKEDIISKVWKNRDAYVEKHHHNLDEILKDLQKRQKKPFSKLIDRTRHSSRKKD